MHDTTSAPRKAVVLAAGTGSRLGALGPKPLTLVHGRSILHRSLDNLAAAGVLETVIVVGHQADRIRSAIGAEHAGMAITYVESDRFRETNNAYSLWLAAEHLSEDVYLVEGDVVFDPALLFELERVPGGGVLAVAPWRRGLSGTVVALNTDGRIERFLVGAQEAEVLENLGPVFKTVNICLLRGDFLRTQFLPRLEALIGGGGTQSYYEVVLAEAVHEGAAELAAADCRHLSWFEVDDLTDLDAACYLFGSDDERLDFLRKQYGGYWRHDVVDHRLLYNLYFPPDRLIEELKADLRPAVVHYPVGHAALQRLLGAVVRQPAECLVIANGASELIKILGRTLGRVALAVPGFNEYEAVFDEAQIERIELQAPLFELDVAAFTAQARAAQVDAVVITSPNNPTAMAVPRATLVQLCTALGEHGTTLVVDESFVDFCEPGQSLENEIQNFPNLVIVKSMSKAYGIGGLRLGYLLAQRQAAHRIREQLPIWNVNGLAESFLRLLPHYQADFRDSCALVRRDRQEFSAMLDRVPGLTVFPSDANYLMVRLPEGADGPSVCRELFAGHGILTKHCGGKSMRDGEQFLRIACRGGAENQAFADALAAVLRAATDANRLVSAQPALSAG
ncbi:histidinol-phosphate/aromatic aminotransferase/cobyric acid decarboxylase-like protein/CTP:phosphocholine cytidylyltransferase-like protein [Streptacidiphilus sp. MAP12-33]|uniref:aminotransferase class I/II-fold pyridoxal phosphate-dependent enzyme n=1 Tax=Streptacidiphilus sp. MAP12-33 TaxID=3156266 RepID=UPI0035128850